MIRTLHGGVHDRLYKSVFSAYHYVAINSEAVQFTFDTAAHYLGRHANLYAKYTATAAVATEVQVIYTTRGVKHSC
jgi:hypothetical protein